MHVKIPENSNLKKSYQEPKTTDQIIRIQIQQIEIYPRNLPRVLVPKKNLTLERKKKKQKQKSLIIRPVYSPLRVKPHLK